MKTGFSTRDHDQRWNYLTCCTSFKIWDRTFGFHRKIANQLEACGREEFRPNAHVSRKGPAPEAR
jgi:hypothetical protein